MSKRNEKPADGRALWERARTPVLSELAAGAPELDESDLAAYLEGDLDAAACARIEAALASRPDSLDLLIASRAALADRPAAPERLAARIRALVPDSRGSRAAVRPWAARLGAWLAALAGGPAAPGRGFALAGVAAGFLAISVVGFELGRAEVVYSTQIDGLLAQEFVGLIERGSEDLL